MPASSLVDESSPPEPSQDATTASLPTTGSPSGWYRYRTSSLNSAPISAETVLVAATAALTLTGPGRYAVDGRRGWATRPRYGSLTALVLAIAAAVCTWIFLHGGSPFS